jgi:predicted nuclease of predicted toxin-antitoxin system
VFILFDENLLSKKLKKPLADAGYFVKNVEEMGWRGVKDRELLALAQAHPFDVFVTDDKNLPYQQNLHGLTLRVIVLDAYSTRPDSLLPLISQISNILKSLASGSVTLINDAGEVTLFEQNIE